MRTRALVWSIGVALACCIASVASAETAAFVLDMAATAQDVPFTVKDPTTIPVKIIRNTAASGATVDVNLTPFTSDQGLVAPVTFSVPNKDPDTHFDKVPFDGQVLAVTLHIPALPAGSKYTGRLVLTTNPPTTTPPTAPTTMAWRFILTSAKELRPAVLVASAQNTLTLAAVRGWCVALCNCLCISLADEPTFSVQLRDKTGNVPVEGVMLRIDGGVKAPGPDADVSRHIRADFNDAKDVNMFAPSLDRGIPARGQATVKLTFHDLSVGEYTIPLQFSAMNSGDDTSQRVTVTLQVRNHAGWAALVLILAALVSFVATRVVTTLKQRASFLSTVRSMRPYWLASEPATLPVIWLRATLRQAENLSNRYWLTGQSEIDERLTGAKKTLAVVTRVHDVRGRISNIARFEVRRRALWRLDSIVKTIPAGALSEQDVTRINTELDKLDSWCTPDKMEGEYWADLKPSIEARHGEVKPELMGTPPSEALAKTLRDKLGDALTTTPKDLDSKIDVEVAYQHLTILWNRKSDKQLRDDLVALATTATIQQIFKLNDDTDWELLKNLKPDQYDVVGPFDETIEAYDPVIFEFKVPGNPTLGESYLVNKKLTYVWTIAITNANTGEKRELRAETTQPKVSQYSPVAGEMKAQVEIKYDGDHGPTATQSRPIAIKPSSDFRVWWIIEAADAWAFGTALLIAVFSGLQAQGLSPTFGTLKDYLMLFAWGASVDQGKNFIQALSNYKSQKV